MVRSGKDRETTLRRRVLAGAILVALACLLGAVAAGAGAGSGTPRAAPAALATNANTPNAVKPTELYQSTPAPVGIADFGIGPGGAPYAYNTTSFTGSMQIIRLEVNSTATGNGAVGLANATLGKTITPLGNTFLPVDALGITVQLNVVLQFVDSGKLYVYWIQDVAGIVPGSCSSTNPVLNFTDYFVGCTGVTVPPDNATAGSISFEDNVWNFSGPHANMTSSSISGSGSVSTFDGVGYYAASAPQGQPGNDVTLEYPKDVQFRVNSQRSAMGVPEVQFQYEDGYGWQTFDSPVFPFATAVTSDSGFVVNGYQYNPWGTFYDAETVLGGAGAGTYSGFGPATNLYLTESYWNGHNYEFIPNAFNFGSDTAESVQYVQAHELFGQANGQIGNKILGGKTETLGPTYNLDQLATVNITTPGPHGFVTVGTERAAWSAGGYAQHLGPRAGGAYQVTVTKGQTPVWQGYVTLGAGETVNINTRLYHSVTFTESGLPAATSWSVALGSVTISSTGTSIVFWVENGPYSYTPSTPASYSASSGTFTMAGHALIVTVTFS